MNKRQFKKKHKKMVEATWESHWDAIFKAIQETANEMAEGIIKIAEEMKLAEMKERFEKEATLLKLKELAENC